MGKATQARSLYQQGRYAEALPLYEDALDKRPKLREAYHELGACYEMLDRDSEAIRTYERGLKNADVKDEVALRALGRLYVHKGYLVEALTKYVAVQAIAPQDTWVAAEISRLEGIKAIDPKVEQARLAKARAKHDEIKGIAERYFTERKFEDAIIVIDTFPEEYRGTEYWVKSLGPLREQCEAARKK